MFDVEDENSLEHDVCGVKVWGRMGWIPIILVDRFIGAPVFSFEETFCRHNLCAIPSKGIFKWRVWFVEKNGVMRVH